VRRTLVHEVASGMGLSLEELTISDPLGHVGREIREYRTRDDICVELLLRVEEFVEPQGGWDLIVIEKGNKVRIPGFSHRTVSDDRDATTRFYHVLKVPWELRFGANSFAASLRVVVHYDDFDRRGR